MISYVLITAGDLSLYHLVILSLNLFGINIDKSFNGMLLILFPEKERFLSLQLTKNKTSNIMLIKRMQ